MILRTTVILILITAGNICVIVSLPERALATAWSCYLLAGVYALLTCPRGPRDIR